jgi:hypothetical protein
MEFSSDRAARSPWSAGYEVSGRARGQQKAQRPTPATACSAGSSSSIRKHSQSQKIERHRIRSTSLTFSNNKRGHLRSNNGYWFTLEIVDPLRLRETVGLLATPG